MKTKTLILSLTIGALCFVVDGFYYSKDESGNDRFGKEYDNRNGFALNQKPGSKMSRPSSRAGQINDFDGEEDFPKSGPPERDYDEDDVDSSPEKSPPGSGPPGRALHKRCSGRGPPGRMSHRYGNSDRDDYRKTRYWQRPSDSENIPERGQPDGGYNRGSTPGYDGTAGNGENEKLRRG